MVSIVSLALGVLHLLGAYNHFAHNLCHDGLSLISSFLHLLMTYLDRVIETTQVCYNADAKGTDTTMVGYDDLWDGTHANGVATQDAIHLILGRRLEGWSLHTHINTILQTDLLFASYLTGQFDESWVVGFVHIGEARTRGEILATQRMLWEEVDMIGDNHQVANLETRIHATSGIADKERLDAQLVHHTNREGDLLHRIALVVVETALHSHNVHSAKLAEDEFSTVAFYR